MRVVVVGAGIGGLAAAVALRTIGAEMLVIERAASTREVGAGLSIWSNAVKALRELGLEDNVLASASVIERNLVQTTKGRPIARTELGEVSQMAGAACVCIHRGILQKSCSTRFRRIRCEPASDASALTARQRSWRTVSMSKRMLLWEQTVFLP